MQVEVIYIDAAAEFIEVVELPAGANVKDAILASGLIEKCGNVSLSKNQVGVFGKQVSLDTTLKSGDRVEVYRPLKLSPMEARRLRAEKSSGTL